MDQGLANPAASSITSFFTTRRSQKINKISLPPSTKPTVLVLRPQIIKNDVHQLTNVVVESSQQKKLNTLAKLKKKYVLENKIKTTKNNQKSEFLVSPREDHIGVANKTPVGAFSHSTQSSDSVHLASSATSKT